MFSHHNFKSNVLEICEASKNHFQWGNREYCSDKFNNIFFSTKRRGEVKLDFIVGAKTTYILEKYVFHYDISIKDHPIDTSHFHNLKELQAYLHNLGIKQIKPSSQFHLDHSSLSEVSDSLNLDKEILNCSDFVSYVIVNSFKDIPNFNYHFFLEKIEPIIKNYFSNADKLPRCFTKDQFELSKGDILFFCYDEDVAIMLENKAGCIHTGFFYGVEDQLPVVLDLWDRDNSNKAKITRFTTCKQYEGFYITYLSLDQLFLELAQILELEIQEELKKLPIAENNESTNKSLFKYTEFTFNKYIGDNVYNGEVPLESPKSSPYETSLVMINTKQPSLPEGNTDSCAPTCTIL